MQSNIRLWLPTQIRRVTMFEAAVRVAGSAEIANPGEAAHFLVKIHCIFPFFSFRNLKILSIWNIFRQAGNSQRADSDSFPNPNEGREP